MLDKSIPDLLLYEQQAFRIKEEMDQS